MIETPSLAAPGVSAFFKTALGASAPRAAMGLSAIKAVTLFAACLSLIQVSRADAPDAAARGADGSAGSAAPGAAAKDKPPSWDKPPAITVENEFLRDRIEEPQNHFLRDGQQGFVSGRDFYQAQGDINAFLWPDQPFLRFGVDRAWLGDSGTFTVRMQGSQELGDLTGGSDNGPGKAGDATAALLGDATWGVTPELRVHGGLDQNALFSSTAYPARKAVYGTGNDARLAWLSDALPERSIAAIGGVFDHRGTSISTQYNRGDWWTLSPVSGRAYAWEGYNADLVYKVGEEFGLQLVDQEWDSPQRHSFYSAHWRRSELSLGFLGASEGNWKWRLDLGFQRREMISDSVFRPFVEKTYPFRFRYHQDWAAPDSIPVTLVTQGTLAFRDRILSVVHSEELQEKWGPHRIRETLKGYFRERMEGYETPTEYLGPDTSFQAASQPGLQARGFAVEAEASEKRSAFELGLAGNVGMEWEYPIFNLQALDTVAGAILRRGSYVGSDSHLQNATVRLYAKGGSERGLSWNADGAVRKFWGPDVDSIEFLPSPWWTGGGLGYALPFGLTADAQVTYIGPKEVRGWGPVFKTPSHFENNVSVSQSFLQGKMKLWISALHAFGHDIQEQPDGNPLRFRILGGLSARL